MSFFVELNEGLRQALADKTYREELPSEWPAEVLESAMEVFTPGKQYPVLAVETMSVKLESGEVGFKTLYHVPMDNRGLVWAPAQLFVFAGLPQ